MTDTFENPIDVLRSRILELESQLALSEDRNFYLAAENARLRSMANAKAER